MSLTVGIVSLGCPRNLVDSQQIAARLIQKHYTISRHAEAADVVIINTCAFIREAKQESVRAILDILDLKKHGQVKKVIVYGCLSQRYREELLRLLPGVDAFVGRVVLDDDLLTSPQAEQSYTAYVKIVEGCGNYCSYCVIPAIKGSVHSRSIESIVREVRRLEAQGVKEIDIVGQDITRYGIDRYGSPQLEKLLRTILKEVKTIPWFRLLYLHPARITDELLDVIASDARVCKYIDMPIQHCNDRILQRMNRQMTKESIYGVIRHIRTRIPSAALRSTVIVGFPSETPEEFQELLDFIRAVRFERLGAFMYSREEGTPAYRFEEQVHHQTKAARLKKIMLAQQEIAAEQNRALLGTQQRVMIDAQDAADTTRYAGRLEYDAPEVDGSVHVRSYQLLQNGAIYLVKITDTMEYDLVGELVTSAPQS